MKKTKLLKNLVVSLLVFAMVVTAMFTMTLGTTVSAEEPASAVTTWDFTGNTAWAQNADLVEMPFSMPGLVSAYTSEQWVSHDGRGLMTIYGGYFVAKVPTNASLTVTFAGAMPVIEVGATASSLTALDITPVQNGSVYTVTIDGIGTENSYVCYNFPSNGGWDNYTYHQLRSFSFSAPDATVWNFIDNASWKQAEQLEGLPFDMPGLVTNYGSQQWVSDGNLGLMTVGGGLFIASVPMNASLTITFAGALPAVSVSNEASGTYTPVDAEPVLNNGVYTLTVDGIGPENRYVMYEFPSNGGWGDYAYHKLRTFSFSASDETIWNFLDNASWTQSETLTGMPFDMPGLTGDYGSQQWVSHDHYGLMTVGGGAFVAKLPTNASLTFTFSGEMPVIDVGATTSSLTALDITPVQNGNVYTVTIDGIGTENSYVLYEFPTNDGWGDYTRHKLRTFSYRASDATVWNFVDNSSWKQAEQMEGLPFDMPGLVTNYGSQQWVSDGNLGLMTVGGGLFIAEVPNDASLTITFSGSGLPTVRVSNEANGTFTPVDAEPVLNNGVYTLTVDGIGIGNRYVKYTFPSNSGWDGYTCSCLRTVTFKAPGLVQDIDSDNLVTLRQYCLGISAAHLSYDFHSDGQINILDLVALKKLLAVR